MANDSSAGIGVVATLAVVLMVAIAAFVAWQAGAFGNGDRKSVDVHVNPGAMR